MATGLDRGAGTEIIRTAMFNNITNTDVTLIFGEQYHIYTILSVVVTSVGGAGSLHGYIQGWDSKAGTGGGTHHLFYQDMTLNNVFVWNDKFSFNGHQPTGVSGELHAGGAAYQDALADQGGTLQYLAVNAENASDNFDVFVTYIDQNNS